MIELAGNRIEVSGDVLIDTSTAVWLAGNEALPKALAASREIVFDWSKVSAVDSSALSVVFGWLRAVDGNGQAKIANPPAELLSLAEVYGVGELLPVI